MSNQVNNGTKLVYLAWFIGALFFFFQFMARVLPNILSEEIFTTFKITADEFSSLGGIYTVTYGLVQIPIGFLLDKIKLRKIAMASISLVLVGLLIFTYADQFFLMQISRFIIALGSGAALGLTLKIVAANFVGISRSFLSGLTISLGVLGPIVGGAIMERLLLSHDWRFAVLSLTVLGCILLISSFFLLKNKASKTNSLKESFMQFGQVLTKPILVYSLLAAALFAIPAVFADLWGSKFLITRFKLNDSTAVSISLSVYWGLALGSLVLPYLAALLDRAKLVICISLFINLIAFSIILIYQDLSEDLLLLLALIMGFFCGAEMICFNAAWHLVPPTATALTVGIINSISLILNGLLQQLVGFIMDRIWDGTLVNGVRFYSEDNYLVALSSVPLMMIFSLIITFLHFRPRPTDL
jgi:MFS family permease